MLDNPTHLPFETAYQFPSLALGGGMSQLTALSALLVSASMAAAAAAGIGPAGLKAVAGTASCDFSKASEPKTFASVLTGEAA